MKSEQTSIRGPAVDVGLVIFSAQTPPAAANDSNASTAAREHFYATIANEYDVVRNDDESTSASGVVVAAVKAPSTSRQIGLTSNGKLRAPLFICARLFLLIADGVLTINTNQLYAGEPSGVKAPAAGSSWSQQAAARAPPQPPTSPVPRTLPTAPARSPTNSTISVSADLLCERCNQAAAAMTSASERLKSSLATPPPSLASRVCYAEAIEARPIVISIARRGGSAPGETSDERGRRRLDCCREQTRAARHMIGARLLSSGGAA